MTTLHINQFEAHYRLPASATHARERERLDAVLKSTLDDVLEGALERAGVAMYEEVCIRHLYVPVRLSLAQADHALALAWSIALADALKRAADGERSEDIVRYGSRVQALTDLAVRVTLGDFQRAWAWRQLGLWRLGDELSDTETAHELMRAWESEPRLIVPSLRALAETGVLQRTLRWLTAAQWMTLAYAALTTVPASLPQDRSGVATRPLPPALRRDGHRLAQASRLAEAFVDAPGSIVEGTATRHALAAFVVLEVEPMALRARRGSETPDLLLEAVANAIWVPLEVLRPDLSASGTDHDDQDQLVPGRHPSMPYGDAEVIDRATVQSTIDPDTEAITPSDPSTASVSSRQREPSVLGESSGPSEPSAPYARQGPLHPKPVPADQSEAPLEAEVNLVAQLRHHARTRFGGLLLLLNVVDELGLPDDIAGHPDLSERSFRWCLHRLGLTLISIEPDDAAALAFAGLSPDTPPPSVNVEPATPREDTAIGAYATRIQDDLRDRLDVAQSIPALMAFVCHRHAEIVADPGWLEVRLSLDSVSVDIRRAGLDLNPGYLPWLGMVVNFVYE